MDIDPTKGYVLIQDNEDGTMTQTLHIPEADVHIVTVIEMSMEEMYETMSSLYEDASEVNLNSLFDKVSDLTTSIPDAPEMD